MITNIIPVILVYVILMYLIFFNIKSGYIKKRYIHTKAITRINKKEKFKIINGDKK
jgi:hypothetical protein